MSNHNQQNNLSADSPSPDNQHEPDNVPPFTKIYNYQSISSSIDNSNGSQDNNNTAAPLKINSDLQSNQTTEEWKPDYCKCGSLHFIQYESRYNCKNCAALVTENWQGLKLEDDICPKGQQISPYKILEQFKQNQTSKTITYPKPQVRQDALKLLIFLHQKFKFVQKTLWLAISYFDLISTDLLGPDTFHLQAITCLVLACKYQERDDDIPLIEDFVCFAPQNNTSARKNMLKVNDVMKAEIKICQFLEWNLTITTPFHFIENYASQGVLFSTDYVLARDVATTAQLQASSPNQKIVPQKRSLQKIKRMVEIFMEFALKQGHKLVNELGQVFSAETIAMSVLVCARETSKIQSDDQSVEDHLRIVPNYVPLSRALIQMSGFDYVNSESFSKCYLLLMTMHEPNFNQNTNNNSSINNMNTSNAAIVRPLSSHRESTPNISFYKKINSVQSSNPKANQLFCAQPTPQSHISAQLQADLKLNLRLPISTMNVSPNQPTKTIKMTINNPKKTTITTNTITANINVPNLNQESSVQIANSAQLSVRSQHCPTNPQSGRITSDLKPVRQSQLLKVHKQLSGSDKKDKTVEGLNPNNNQISSKATLHYGATTNSKINVAFKQATNHLLQNNKVQTSSKATIPLSFDQQNTNSNEIVETNKSSKTTTTGSTTATGMSGTTGSVVSGVKTTTTTLRQVKLIQSRGSVGGFNNSNTIDSFSLGNHHQGSAQKLQKVNQPKPPKRPLFKHTSQANLNQNLTHIASQAATQRQPLGDQSQNQQTTTISKRRRDSSITNPHNNFSSNTPFGLAQNSNTVRSERKNPSQIRRVNNDRPESSCLSGGITLVSQKNQKNQTFNVINPITEERSEGLTNPNNNQISLASATTSKNFIQKNIEYVIKLNQQKAEKAAAAAYNKSRQNNHSQSKTRLNHNNSITGMYSAIQSIRKSVANNNQPVVTNSKPIQVPSLQLFSQRSSMIKLDINNDEAHNNGCTGGQQVCDVILTNRSKNSTRIGQMKKGSIATTAATTTNTSRLGNQKGSVIDPILLARKGSTILQNANNNNNKDNNNNQQALQVLQDNYQHTKSNSRLGRAATGLNNSNNLNNSHHNAANNHLATVMSNHQSKVIVPVSQRVSPQQSQRKQPGQQQMMQRVNSTAERPLSKLGNAKINSNLCNIPLPPSMRQPSATQTMSLQQNSNIQRLHRKNSTGRAPSSSAVQQSRKQSSQAQSFLGEFVNSNLITTKAPTAQNPSTSQSASIANLATGQSLMAKNALIFQKLPNIEERV